MSENQVITGASVEALLKLADDMESAMSGGPEFIGRSGLRFNASERIRRILMDERDKLAKLLFKPENRDAADPEHGIGMSAHDELTELIQDVGEYIPGSHADDYISPSKAASVILAAGYRKVTADAVMFDDAAVERGAQAMLNEIYSPDKPSTVDDEDRRVIRAVIAALKGTSA